MILLEMLDTKDTIEKLQNKIPLAYPMDLPDVKANIDLWIEVKHRAVAYMQNNGRRDPDMFAKCRVPNENTEKGGLACFERENVFGNDPQNRLPSDLGFDFDALFDCLAKDFAKGIKKGDKDHILDVLGMINATYQGHNILFDEVRDYVLSQFYYEENVDLFIKNIVYYEENPHIRYFSFCANMLVDPDLQENYLLCFIEKSKDLIKITRNKTIAGMWQWIRALSHMLMYNGRMLESVETRVCNACMEVLLALANHFAVHKKNTMNSSDNRLFRFTVKCILGLLRRRKFDPGFLSTEQEKKKVHEILRHRYLPKSSRTLASVVEKFVDGTGRLSDFISVAKDINDGGGQ